RGPLMRVLAVPEVRDLGERGDERLRECFDVAEPLRDRGFVRGRRREGLRSECAPGRCGEVSAVVQLGQHRFVALRLADRCDVREVLRRPTQHGWPADVDHLDRVLLAHPVPPGDFAERIKVDADEVERTDRLLVERRNVIGVVAPGEDGGVDPGMKRLDAAAEHLGDARELLYPLDVEPDLVLEKIGRPTARHELEAELGQAAGELLQAGLVVDGDQRTHSSATTSGRIRCSTAWIRSTRLSRGSTSTGSWRITAPVSSPPST